MTPDQQAAENVRKLKLAADSAEIHRQSLVDLGWNTSPLRFDAEGLPYFTTTVPAGVTKKAPKGQLQKRTFHLDGSMEVTKL